MWLERIGSRYGSRVARFGYTTRLQPLATSCCESKSAHWSSGAIGMASVDHLHGGDLLNQIEPHSTASSGGYAAMADLGVGVGLHVGKVALVVATNFLSAFNGMQQRAAQLTVHLTTIASVAFCMRTFHHIL